MNELEKTVDAHDSSKLMTLQEVAPLWFPPETRSKEVRMVAQQAARASK